MAMQIGKRVNARAALPAAHIAQAEPVYFLGKSQALLRTKAAFALPASKRSLTVVARAATEEKPEVARVTTLSPTPGNASADHACVLAWSASKLNCAEICWRKYLLSARLWVAAARRGHRSACRRRHLWIQALPRAVGGPAGNGAFCCLLSHTPAEASECHSCSTCKLGCFPAGAVLSIGCTWRG